MDTSFHLVLCGRPKLEVCMTFWCACQGKLREMSGTRENIPAGGVFMLVKLLKIFFYTWTQNRSLKARLPSATSVKIAAV